MKLLQIALLGIIAGTAHAAPMVRVDIPEGTEVECQPFPGLDVIRNAIAIKEGRAQGVDAVQLIVTCTVMPNQVVPAQSAFIGEVQEVAAHHYAVVWHRLNLRGAGGWLSWEPNEKDLVALDVPGTENLRLAFNRGLKVSQSPTVN